MLVGVSKVKQVKRKSSRCVMFGGLKYAYRDSVRAAVMHRRIQEKLDFIVHLVLNSKPGEHLDVMFP